LLKLYDGDQTGGAYLRACFAELGIPFTLARLDLEKDDQFGAAYSQINPRNQVPAVVFDDGMILTEAPVIMQHICDSTPGQWLLPAAGTAERAQILRWMHFFATNVYEAESRKVRPSRFVTDRGCHKSLIEAADLIVDRHYQLFNDALGEGPFFRGEQVSLLDPYVWMLAQWHHDLATLEEKAPKVLRLVRAVMARARIAPVHHEIFGVGIGLDRERGY